MHSCCCRNSSQVVRRQPKMWRPEGESLAGRGSGSSARITEEGQRQPTGEDAGGWRGINGIDELHRAGWVPANRMTAFAAQPPVLAGGPVQPADAEGARNSRSRSTPPSSASTEAALSGAILWPSCMPTACLGRTQQVTVNFTSGGQCAPRQRRRAGPPDTTAARLAPRCVSTAAIYPVTCLTWLALTRCRPPPDVCLGLLTLHLNHSAFRLSGYHEVYLKNGRLLRTTRTQNTGLPNHAQRLAVL